VPVGPSNLCRLAHAAALPLYEPVHIEHGLAFSQIIDGARELMGEDRQGLACTVLVLQALRVLLPWGGIDQAQDGGF
jgi:hypothetical protein